MRERKIVPWTDNRVTVQLSNGQQAAIPGRLWGYADDFSVLKRNAGGPQHELCVTFVSEDGFSGGEFRLADLLKVLAEHQPELLRDALNGAPPAA